MSKYVHIGLERMDENRKTLEECDVNFADFINKLEAVEGYEEDFPILSSIDPWGDTYFNILQRPKLIQELSRLGFDKSATNKVIDFLNRTGTHEYVVFIGD